MQIKELLEISTVILGSLGGGAVIIFGMSNWLGKVWANRLMAKEKAAHNQELETLRKSLSLEIESYKLKLKKSEFIFQKEYEAASEFVALKRSCLPYRSFPNMDWYDACDQVIDNLSTIENALNKYLSKHGAVLGKEVNELLSNSLDISSENKFELGDDSIPGEVYTAIETLLENLNKIEGILVEKVHTQTSN